MKNYTITLAFMLVAVSVGMIHSCKKESLSTSDTSTPYTGSPIAKSFTEEFVDFNTLVSRFGWITKSNTNDTLSNSFDDWGQGTGGDRQIW